MDWSSFVFILSASLQAAGALVLMVSFWNNIYHETLKVIFPSILIAYRDNDNNVVIKKRELYKASKHIYLNRCAFVYLALGYILGVLGNNDTFGWCTIMLLLTIMGLLILFSLLISSLHAKRAAKEDKRISYEELNSILGREVPTNITTKELEELLI